MIALVTFFLVIVASLTATRVATIALTLTGVSPQVARFQARSALSGSGFTTSESESIVNHPARRRIVMFLMLVGSAGLVTAIATLSISFVGQESSVGNTRLAVLAGGCMAVLVLSRSRIVDRLMTAVFTRVLRRFTDLELQDYAGLLHLADGHAILEFVVEAGDWLCSRTLGELQLREEGVTVLGIERSRGGYVGVPGADTDIRPGDTLVTYGNYDALVELSSRQPGPDGDAMHREAIESRRHRDLND